ncbi:MAG: prepilin-type N-terminal cleavage/methylation domain-containing protein, partial [Bdellovibrionaceae bacterium]|nr:prepilin-type N-terminal cleavage/methylation domain-containing protein [Pseudobdellovibrionaceae bacterium]
MKSRLQSSEHGFTLIEIMVALVILAGLSVMIAQSIKTGLQSKAKIQLQIEEESALRDA